MFDLLETIYKHSETQPSRVAVQCGEQRLSYEGLAVRINDIAATLRQADVRPGDQVGICIARGIDLVPSMLAVLSLGGAFVPLDPLFPLVRLTRVLSGTNLRCVLVDDTTPALPAKCIEIDTVGTTADVRINAQTAADGLAYIMHTSGSTGTPKGVQVSYGNLENLLNAMQQQFKLKSHDRLLAVTTIAFDISILELFLPLLSGAAVVIATVPQTRDGQELQRLIAIEDITIMQATPATWQMMLATGWQGEPSLTALCGGEALPLGLAHKLAPRVAALWNMYGPTETTIWSTCAQITGTEDCIVVGNPISNTGFIIVDDQLNPVGSGEQGELLLSGAGVCLGYTDEALNADRFVHLSRSGKTKQRFYRTGDLAKLSTNGEIVLLGRSDDQIKIRGFRIELDDVSNGLNQIPGISAAKATCVKNPDSTLSLFGFCSADAQLTEPEIRAAAAKVLPAYMIPDRILLLSQLPVGPNGKIDKAALDRIASEQVQEMKHVAVEESLLEVVIQHVAAFTHADEINATTDVFDAGLTSLQANILAARLSEVFGKRVAVAQIFETPKIGALLAALEGTSAVIQPTKRKHKSPSHSDPEQIAIVGMALRVPGADTPDAFWEIIEAGRDTVTRFHKEQDDPLVPEDIRENPNYIRARGILPNPDRFDASFFGISPNDAKVMDPQQRVFLELAWHALEDAGHCSGANTGTVAVYAGMGNNFYYHHHVATNPDFIRMVGEVQAEIGREKDHIATLVSHKLNLTGPSISVHTACSTGLIAIDQACHSLLSRQSDMALAGAIELCTPQMSGQIGEPAGIFTEDGACRPFSADATGTMFSDGAGILVLKRLSDAQRDGDRIVATLRGTAVNHDGSQKKSYLAPSARAQIDVMKLAQKRAGIDPRSIGYIEAHGTATPVGDPIEFSGLCAAFDHVQDGRCAIGSVKANLGHPTTAAGVIGVIKAALCLQHKIRPPLANFTGGINPQINIEDSPFYIPTAAETWKKGTTPRRAAVSSFGFCGTNAHAILEEAPATTVADYPARKAEILVASAKTETALIATTAQFATTIQHHNLPAAAYTLATRRSELALRSFATDPHDFSHPVAAAETPPKLAFVFPGQGTQYTGMGLKLAGQEPDIAASLADVSGELAKHLDCDIRDVIKDGGALSQTIFTQPALFAIELAMASRLHTLGLTPDVLIGHSVGEFAAAVIAGVMSLPDAARMVCCRARLMNEQPTGAMIATRLSEQQLQPFLTEGLECAVLNGPNAAIAGGPKDKTLALKASLEDAGHRSVILHTSHAFHTSAMDDACNEFAKAMTTIDLNPPTTPIISTMTGQFMTEQQAQDPVYWADQIRKPVRYGQAIETLWSEPAQTLVEVGPGHGLSQLAAAGRTSRADQNTLATIKADTDDGLTECHSMAKAIGKLWAIGHDINWTAYFAGRCQSPISLPGYVFDHKSYWLDPGQRNITPASASTIDMNDGACVIEELNKDTIVEELRIIFGSASGRDFADVPEKSAFYDEGLDSLLLTQIIFMIKECYDVTVSFRGLNRELNNLSALAGFIVSESLSETEDRMEIAHVTDAESVPLTPKQRAVLDDPDTRLEQVSATIILAGQVDHARLDEALDTLSILHAALRATLDPDAEMIVIADNPLPRAATADIKPEQGRALWYASKKRVDHGLELTLTLHGIIGDGWSLDVLIEDLAALYTGRILEPAPSLNQTDIATLLPRGVALPDGATTPALHKHSTICKAKLDAERSYARSNGCTLFTAWLTHIFLEMHRHCTDQRVGLFVASAMQPRLNMPRLVTNCMDYLPLTQDPPPADINFTQMSASLKDTLIDANEFPCDDLVARPVQIDLGHGPVVGEFVHITRLMPTQHQFGDLKSQYTLQPPSVLRADFRITLIEDSDQVEIICSRKNTLKGDASLDAFLNGIVKRLTVTEMRRADGLAC